jgi:hypothetical protein
MRLNESCVLHPAPAHGAARVIGESNESGTNEKRMKHVKHEEPQ